MPLEAPVTLNGVAARREHSLFQRLLSAQAFWVTVALLIMCAVMSVLQPQAFASSENFYNITRNFAFIGIMALGMTTVIVTGGIDLSVGSVMGLAAIVAGLVLQDGGAWWLAVVLSQNKMIYDFGPDADTIFAIGGGQMLGIANPVWVLLALTAVFSAV